jgi:hypothetical protein
MKNVLFVLMKYIYMWLGYTLFWLQFAKMVFSAAKIKTGADFLLKM